MTEQKKNLSSAQDKDGRKKKNHMSQQAGQPSKKGRWLNLCSMVLALAAIGTAGYVYVLSYQMEDNRQTQMFIFKNRVTQLKAQQDVMRAALNNAEKMLASTKEKFSQRMTLIDNQLQQSLKENNYNQEDWQLLKAQYYLELAEVNAHWSADKDTSIALLHQADRVLSHIHQKGILDIRQQLAKEISQMSAVQNVDVAGILGQLDAVSQMVNDLPRGIKYQQKSGSGEQAQKNTVADDKSTWRKKLDDSVSVLEKLVIIRKEDQFAKRILSPVYVAIIRESIQLNLQQAQWAVLNRNKEVYEITLRQAKNSLLKYFSSYKETKALVQQLMTLKALNIRQSSPDIHRSLSMLNQLIKTKQTRSVAENGGSD